MRISAGIFSSMDAQVHNPQCAWAETKEFIFLTVQVQSPEDLQVNLQESSLDFKCTSDKKAFAFHLDFPHPIIVEDSKYSVQRNVQFKLVKKEKERWRTLSGKTKLHWLKCDWDKWIDSDDEDAKGMDMGDFDMNSMDFGGMGGLGGMGGMGGLGGMGDMGGLGGMGDMDFGDMGDMDSDDEDDLHDLDDSMQKEGEHEHEGGCCGGHGKECEGEKAEEHKVNGVEGTAPAEAAQA
ncbi:UNVERIFIED_CONTAM: hypothetical protein HHA_321520 [Hammondia hammondi]|eukprot:XP_008888487.1 hypothetical protein HHA_321520 [Hammondia hammondi]